VGGISNPADPIDSATDTDVGGGGTIGNIPSDRPLLPGDTVTSPVYACAGYKTEWWICPPAYVANNVGVLEENLAEACELVDEGSEYLVTAAASGKHIVAIGRCPDPSAPDGFGPATGATTTDPVGGGTATWDPYPGAVRYRLQYTPGFGTFLGDFIEIPYVLGITGAENCIAPREKAAYLNPDNDTIYTVGGSVCWIEGTAKSQFALYALDADNNVIATLPRVNL
jgi:hypothetical protein